MRRCFFIWMLAASACATPSVPDGGADAGPSSCLGADAAACDAASCVGIKGWRSTGSPSTIDGGGEYAGCAVANDLDCGQTFTCATSPVDGACWLFKNTCLPEGWATVSCLDPSLFCPSIH